MKKVKNKLKNPKMSLQIEPAEEINFQQPFTQAVKQQLKLSNTGTTPIAFKVKTTAPKQYVVRPNSGKILPGGFMEVVVILQPIKEAIPADVKCKDKFLIQSIEISQELGNESNLDVYNPKVAEKWTELEALKKSDPTSKLISESKIKCVYLAEISNLLINLIYI